jgi:hypothetical protein
MGSIGIMRDRMYCTVLYGKSLVICNKEGRCASRRTKDSTLAVTVATGVCPDTVYCWGTRIDVAREFRLS